jgi:hypothetical protein
VTEKLLGDPLFVNFSFLIPFIQVNKVFKGNQLLLIIPDLPWSLKRQPQHGERQNALRASWHRMDISFLQP